MPLCRLDLHLHTQFSHDCDTDIPVIEAHCLRQGLTGLAVTDHNTIKGAIKLRDSVKSIRVIVAEEVSTRDGDVIGLFLQEEIKSEAINPKITALEAMKAIHEQGGLVYLPHPFDRQRARKTKGASLSGLIDQVDIVEAFNGKVSRSEYNNMAAEYALHHHKITGGGSDAHDLRAIGSVYNELELPNDFTPGQFLEGMATAKIVGTRRSKMGSFLVIGRRPFSMALRHLRKKW